MFRLNVSTFVWCVTKIANFQPSTHSASNFKSILNVIFVCVSAACEGGGVGGTEWLHTFARKEFVSALWPSAVEQSREKVFYREIVLSDFVIS
jgi:hypothetical protein